MLKSRTAIASMIIILVVLIDRAVKIWIKTHFYLGEDLQIFSGSHCISLKTTAWLLAWSWEANSP